MHKTAKFHPSTFIGDCWSSPKKAFPHYRKNFPDVGSSLIVSEKRSSASRRAWRKRAPPSAASRPSRRSCVERARRPRASPRNTRSHSPCRRGLRGLGPVWWSRHKICQTFGKFLFVFGCIGTDLCK